MTVLFQWGEMSKTTANVQKSIVQNRKDGTMKAQATKEKVEVHTIGKIDKSIYRCITEDIMTDEVIITDERIRHIKDRHPLDYERFCDFMPEIISEPDYILQANMPNTAMILKEVTAGEVHFQLVLKIATPIDDPSFKNSVITFLKISTRTWNKYLRNKKILYKRE